MNKSIKTSLILLVVALVFFGAGIYIKKEDNKFSTSTSTPPIIGQIASTTTVTTVSTSTTNGRSSIQLDSGINGDAMVGPSCPVMQNPPQSGCEDKPYVGIFKLLNSSGQLVTRFSSDQNGKFSVAVPPGKYQIQSDSKVKFPSGGSASDILVSSHSYTTVHLQFDSGIR